MSKLKNSKPISLKNVNIKDEFWSEYQKLVKEVVIPYQWEALNDNVSDAEPSYAIRNFRIAAGEEQGEFGGMVFQDSDVAKWLEAVGYSLAINTDAELEKMADKTIDLIEKAQQPDGYLDTYFTIKEPGKRWTNLKDCHELYCAGHMMEAAVAYYYGTGKRKLLDIMCRYADYIDSVFGVEPGKIRGYCGHQEVELALVKLYRATGNDRYLKLAKYFIDERGQKPYFFEEEWEKRGKTSYWQPGVTPKPDESYHQAHKPVREQTEATGHAVRVVYMCTGMADIAAETGDVELLKACRRLWDDIVNRQMYVTGGIGSTNHGEAFSFDYDLPNDTVYAETCASIGLIFFAHRMLQIEAKGNYADVMERALYNTVVSGMSKDGRHFFYVNPLEVWPEASEKNPSRTHVKSVRQKWFGCACCPPNVARLLTSLGEYIYTSSENTVYTHLYIGGEAKMELEGEDITILQETDYPWRGLVKMKLSMDKEKEFNLALRIPGWCRKAEIFVNGEAMDISKKILDGYAILHRAWKDGDYIELKLDMNAEFIQANPKVRADAGKLAIQRGPLVYCIEEIDNGSNLNAISIDAYEKLEEEYDKDLLGGAVVIKAKGSRIEEKNWENELYRPFENNSKEAEIKAVPYYLWGNRTPGEMLVWIRNKN
ncbi:glycoside hydrolase family 127 protein [Clostridium sp. 19966]|uniref:glycoside hydrolase family 127 protein n=1 Tax=Clostridium sp. 19966 TaxID=2768166 RepID=UPI0028E05373|nr:beta-L-arabinofuranosidase domain-containing protein [Clostridium sp. 19966]MDT8715115.1 glycoside hydrolase family 127 protein [Clostridium sp. 19966]